MPPKIRKHHNKVSAVQALYGSDHQHTLGACFVDPFDPQFQRCSSRTQKVGSADSERRYPLLAPRHGDALVWGDDLQQCIAVCERIVSDFLEQYAYHLKAIRCRLAQSVVRELEETIIVRKRETIDREIVRPAVGNLQVAIDGDILPVSVRTTYTYGEREK